MSIIIPHRPTPALPLALPGKMCFCFLLARGVKHLLPWRLICGLAVPCAWNVPVLELGRFSGSLFPISATQGKMAGAARREQFNLCDERSPASVLSGQGAQSCF